MKYYYNFKKYSGSFLEESDKEQTKEIICKNCNSVGHTEGFCGIYFKKFYLKGYEYA